MLAKLSGNIAYSIGLILWVVFALFMGQLLASAIVLNLGLSANESVLATILAALGYTFGLALAIGVPVLLTRKPISKETLGISRFPLISDSGLGILAVLPYYILSAAILWIGMDVLNVIDPEVGQQIPFQNLMLQIEFIVAFITLVIMAPFAEELLFRGYFLGRLSEKIGKWVAVVVTAVVFGLMHLIGTNETGVVLQWSAAADTFAMGLAAGSLRAFTGSIWAGVVLHAVKNGIAFYFLFIFR